MQYKTRRVPLGLHDRTRGGTKILQNFEKYLPAIRAWYSVTLDSTSTKFIFPTSTVLSSLIQHFLTSIQYFLTLVLFTFCTCCILRCLVCIVVSCLVRIVVVVLCVLLSSYVYLLYYVCIAVFTLLLASSQYSEGPATDHLDTGFSWFPCVYKQTLRWFSRFQVAATCFSCSPPDLNLLVNNFIFCIHVK